QHRFDAGGGCPLHHVLAAMRGHHHEMRCGLEIEGADGLRGLEPVQGRHLPIEIDRADRLSRGCLNLHLLRPFPSPTPLPPPPPPPPPARGMGRAPPPPDPGARTSRVWNPPLGVGPPPPGVGP